jgi:hypothetical protein
MPPRLTRFPQSARRLRNWRDDKVDCGKRVGKIKPEKAIVYK